MSLLIFTEAGFSFGFGHFYRMSGLCDRALSEGTDVRMYLVSDDTARENLNKDYVYFNEWLNCQDFSSMISPEDTAVVDSYHVDLDTLFRIRDAAKNMVVIDDNDRMPYERMLVLNPNYFAPFMKYPDDKGNTYLLGKDYTLLRDPFVRRVDRQVRRKASDILITMGGTDLKGLTSAVVDKLHSLISEDVRLHVVMTHAYPEQDMIREKLRPQDRCYMDIGAEEMSSLMEMCDFAVATAGGTSNELIRMQCPSILIVVADNQENNVRYMTEAGFFDTFTTDDMDRIGTMLEYGKRAEMASKLSSLYSDQTAVDYIMKLTKGETI